MAKEYIPLFLDFNETTSALSDEECGRLVRAVIDYANGKEPELTGIERVLFPFFKGVIDRNTALSETRRKAVSTRYETENNVQNSTNGYKTLQNDETATKSINKKQEQKTKTKNENKKQEQEQKFTRFWTAYPRKVSKETARKAFERLNPDDDLLAAMIEAIERQKLSPQWQENGGKFIPHPATWLHGRRWEDEPQTIRAVEITQAGNGYVQRDNTGAANEALERMRQMILEDERGRLA